MKRTLCCLVLFSLPCGLGAGEKSPPVPLRYAGLHQTKYLELKEVLGYPEQVSPAGHTAVLSRDGARGLFAGGGSFDIDGRTDESFLSLWDVAKGRPVRELRIPGKAISVLALSPDGKRALVGLYGSEGRDKGKDTSEIAYWDLETGKALHHFPAPMGKEKEVEVYIAAAFAPEGKRAIVSGGRGTVQYLDLEKGKVLASPEPGKRDVGSICMASCFLEADQVFLVWGNEVHLWDLKKNSAVRSYKGHREDIISLALSSDGKYLASSGLDTSLRCWDVAKGTEVGELKKPLTNQPLLSMAFTGTGMQLVTVLTGNDPMSGLPIPAEVSLWDPADKDKKLPWTGKADLHGLVPIAIAGKSVVLGGGANPFCRWDLAKGVEEKVWGGHKSAITALAAFKGLVVSGGQEGHLMFWREGVPVLAGGHEDAVSVLRAGENDLLLSGSADKSVKLWNAKTAEVLKTFKGHEGNVTAAVFAPGQKWIATAGGDRLIRTWDLESGKQIEALSGHSEGINGLAISPDGKWLATASDDNTVRLWPVSQGKRDKDQDVVVLEGHKRQVMCLTFTPDGKHLISGSQDKTLRVWDVAKEKTVKVLEGHQNWISSVLVWNGKVVSAADDFRVIVWDLEAGKLADGIDLTPYGDTPRSLGLAADGRGFLIGTSGWVILRLEAIK